MHIVIYIIVSYSEINLNKAAYLRSCIFKLMSKLKIQDKLLLITYNI